MFLRRTGVRLWIIGFLLRGLLIYVRFEQFELLRSRAFAGYSGLIFGRVLI